MSHTRLAESGVYIAAQWTSSALTTWERDGLLFSPRGSQNCSCSTLVDGLGRLCLANFPVLRVAVTPRQIQRADVTSNHRTRLVLTQRKDILAGHKLPSESTCRVSYISTKSIFTIRIRPCMVVSPTHLGYSYIPISWRSAHAILRTKDVDHEIDVLKVRFISILLNTKNKFIGPIVIPQSAC